MNATVRKATDRLTGLHGYDTFRDRLEACLKANRKKETPVSVALVDVDFFGKVNQDHGRDSGDEVLNILATHLSEQFAGEAEVTRFGGDAFGVLFDGVEKEQAFLKLEPARVAFEGEHAVGKKRMPLTVSMGLAAFPDDSDDATLLIRKANEALYRAKVTGRNKVCLAREEKMVTKTTHYTQGQLHGLSRLAKREGIGEATLLREALDDLLRKYNA